MAGRERAVKRQVLSREEKAELLKKTDGKCAHCGVGLTPVTCTVDHAIPLGKGGNNHEFNLVPLCRDCNEDKNDIVMEPATYFKYLNESALSSLTSLYDLYCENITWLYTKNYTREDKTLMHYLSVYHTHRMYAHSRKSDARIADVLVQTATLEKATYADLDKILEYIIKYQKKMGLEYDYIKDRLSEYFDDGCIYMLVRAGEILGVFPVKISYVYYPDTEGYTFQFAGIPCVYQRDEYVPLVARCIRTICEGVALSNKQKAVTFHISVPKKDEFAAYVISVLSRYGTAWISDDSDDTWMDVGIINYYNVAAGEIKKGTVDIPGVIKSSSAHMVKIFNLRADRRSPKEKSDDHHKQQSLSNQKAKELRRVHRAHIDEYDERYYRC